MNNVMSDVNIGENWFKVTNTRIIDVNRLNYVKDFELKCKILEKIHNFENIENISKSLNLSYGKLRTIIVNKMVKEGFLTHQEYKSYVRETRDREIFNNNKHVYQYIKQGVSPTQIADKVKQSRQNIHLIIDWLVRHNYMTEKEKADYIKNGTRKELDSTIIKKQKINKLIELIKQNVTNLDILSVATDLKKEQVILYLGEIKGNCDDISDELLYEIRYPKEIKKAQKKEKIISEIYKDIKTHTYVELAEKYNIALLTAFNYVKEAINRGYISQEEYDSIMNRRTRSKKTVNK